MLLAVDVGNSHTLVGVFRGEELVQHWRLSTDVGRSSDELALAYSGLLGFADLDFSHNFHGVVLSSVVPTVTETYRQMMDDYFPFPPVVVEPGVRTGIPLRYENPREIGADRIANSVAAEAIYGGPAIVVDFGTSTNFDAIGTGGEFLGGVIAPGVHTSTEALVRKAARLPTVETAVPPTAIGRTTTHALQAGIVFGFAGQVDAIVTRMASELGPGVTTVSTGSLTEAVRATCTTLDHHDPWLTLKGLRIIWDRNTGR
jgi:type III pantothenate kinase